MALSRTFLLRLLLLPSVSCYRPRLPISRLVCKFTSTMAAIRMGRGPDSGPAQPRTPDSMSGVPISPAQT